MPNAVLLLAFLTLQRVAELVIAQRNTRALRARGAYEAGAGHYPVMVAMHVAWLASLWLLGWNREVQPGFVVLYAALQLGRVWVIRTLGDRWTTRIIMLPGSAPVVRGPFRFVRHPNYLIVALELPCVSLSLGLTGHAAIFGVLNLMMLAWRIRAENAAFARLRPANP